MSGRIAAKMIVRLVRAFDAFPLRRGMLKWMRSRRHLDLLGDSLCVRMKVGTLMKVDPADYDGWDLLNNRGVEPETGKVFEAILAPGDCAMDIGANQGYFSLLASSLVGPKGRVHSFEPNPYVAERLAGNVALNGFENITVHAEAASNACGTAEFHIAPPTHTGLSSLRPMGDGAGATVATVRTVTIDSLLGEIKDVKLVKIDVEGAELLVLQGMTGLMRRDKPAVLLEATPSWLKEMHGDANALLEFLRANGYTAYEPGSSGVRPVDTLPAFQTNLLCLDRGAPVPEALRGNDPAR